jgi:ATP-binding cassette subfamily C protein
MVALMAVAGLAEGIGVVTLIPVLEVADAGAEPTSDVGRTVVRALRAVGLEPRLSVLLAAIVVLITIKAVFLLLANRQVGYTLARVTRDLRLQLMRALLRVRWRYFSTRTIGQFANSITTEAQRSSAAYKEACFLLAALIQVAAYVTVLSLISWRVAVGTIAVGVLMSWVLRRFVREGRSAGRVQTQLNRSLSSRIVDVLQGIKPLKAMGREELVWPLLEEETDGLMVAQRRQVLAAEGLKAFQEPLLTLLLATGLFLVLDVGGQPLSSTLVLAFVFYRLMRHINTMQERYQTMTVGESAFFALTGELGEALGEEEHPGGGVVPGPLRDGIEMRGLRFAYGDHPVLQEVDVTIPAGTFVAIAGESGSGKTTLADLVAGLYEPESGEILVDGVPLREAADVSYLMKDGRLELVRREAVVR